MTTWEPTRRGAKKFARECVEGRTYYTVHESVQPWGNELVYREWIFKKERFLGVKSLRCGHMGPLGVIAGYGPISDEKPVGPKPLFGKPDVLYNPLQPNGDSWDEYEQMMRQRVRAGR